KSRLSLEVTSAEGESAVLDLPPGPSQSARRQSTRIVATLGRPAGFDLSGSANVRVELDGVHQLPAHADGFESLDALVVAGDDFLADASPEQLTALREWVREGGHLIVSAGRSVEAYHDSPLAEWIPIAVGGPTTLRQLSGLEAFAGQSTRIALSRRTGVPAAQIEPPDVTDAYRVIVTEVNRPLVVRAPVGFGVVTLVAVDLDVPPLSTWEGIGTFGRRLIGRNEGRAAEGDTEAGGQIGQSGISDLGTQLYVAQEQFPRVRRLSSWAVMGLIALYLALIGPVEYLLVHRLLKRPRLTWISFPLMVGLAVALAAWGARASNGEQVRLNQIDIVDLDAATDPQHVHRRGQTWMTLYSPESTRYRVEVRPIEMGDQPQADASAARVAWFGIPEDNFGGMYREGGLELGRAEYRFAPRARAIDNLPVAVWSTRALTADWDGDGDGLVASRLQASSLGHLSGVVEHALPAPIEDWIVAYGNRVYFPANERVATIAPGQRWSTSLPGVMSRELAGYLTGTVQIRIERALGTGGDIRIERTPYNSLSRDPRQIVEMLTFHQQAGGTAYTTLTNTALSELDLSRTVELDRAVLFGRIETPAARLMLAETGEETLKELKADRHATFVRILLPVERDPRTRTELPKFD
ncbi:MAG: hypothetical protein ACREIV_04195, partial [Planctomycetaceae bacterium]